MSIFIITKNLHIYPHITHYIIHTCMRARKQIKIYIKFIYKYKNLKHMLLNYNIYR